MEKEKKLLPERPVDFGWLYKFPAELKAEKEEAAGRITIIEEEPWSKLSDREKGIHKFQKREFYKMTAEEKYDWQALEKSRIKVDTAIKRAEWLAKTPNERRMLRALASSIPTIVVLIAAFLISRFMNN